ncbi:hypothetical protein [Clostridium amylolyticum]|uniref:hypothetical protein n=1 Tax=Clostridium amylolyticum TaxID=1121298 RepID=UPI000934FC2C|nr:hypothetical protein [Clostridium amylolyticum]
MDNMDIMYKCLICDKQEVVKASDHRKDGRSCKYCGGHLSPIGYVGIDLGKGKDKTVRVYPPVEKNEKL